MIITSTGVLLIGVLSSSPPGEKKSLSFLTATKSISNETVDLLMEVRGTNCLKSVWPGTTDVLNVFAVWSTFSHWYSARIR